jgi:hypothetical protein
MAYNKRHKCDLTVELLEEIEAIIGRLKSSVSVSQIRNWIENFEYDDAAEALHFLLHLEYIPSGELQYRLEEQLKNVLKTVDKSGPVVFVPFGEYPKSSDVVIYFLNKIEIFKQNIKRFTVIRQPNDLKITEDCTVIFVDDFVGTADSFIDWHNENDIETILRNDSIKIRQILLSAIIMDEAVGRLKEFKPEMEIFSELRYKAFSEKNSPFNYLGKRELLKAICLKYGADIPVKIIKPETEIFAPLGYGDSESLLAFDYGTPNNTVSIIWGEQKWYPMYPRFATQRMEKAKEIKRQMGFYTGIMKKLKIEISDSGTIEHGEKSISYNSQADFAILTYIFLKAENFSQIIIGQIIGITETELFEILKVSRAKKLLDNKYEITELGRTLVSQIKKKANLYDFRKDADTIINSEVTFIPKTFNQMT